MKLPMFFGKKGYWGEHGMIRISFWKWLMIKREHITAVRWRKVKLCWNIKENMVKQK
jgi:hypothetical protein